MQLPKKQHYEDPSIKIVKPEPRMVNIKQGKDWHAPIMADLHHHYKLDKNTEKLKCSKERKHTR
jgi:hypothetical protein